MSSVSIAKTLSGVAAVLLLATTSAMATGTSYKKECKLDKLGNGPRHCQCEALRHKLLPKKVLWRLSMMNVCGVEIGQGTSPPVSQHPPSEENCDDDYGGDKGGGVQAE